jgi:hypothetical protein
MKRVPRPDWAPPDLIPVLPIQGIGVAGEFEPRPNCARRWMALPYNSAVRLVLYIRPNHRLGIACFDGCGTLADSAVIGPAADGYRNVPDKRGAFVWEPRQGPCCSPVRFLYIGLAYPSIRGVKIAAVVG